MKLFNPVPGQFPLIASANAVWKVSESSSYNVGIAKSAIELNLDIESSRRCKIYFATGANEILSHSSDGVINEAELPYIPEQSARNENESNIMVFDGEFEPGDIRIFRIKL